MNRKNSTVPKKRNYPELFIKIKYFPWFQRRVFRFSGLNVSKAFLLTLRIHNGSFGVMGGTVFIINIILSFSFVCHVSSDEGLKDQRLGLINAN